EEVLELLTDPDRCQVLLVTLPEETPVNEAVETAARLRDRVGIRLGAIVVNGLYPTANGLLPGAEQLARLPEADAAALSAAADFRRSRQDLQQEQLARLSENLDLPPLHL